MRLNNCMTKSHWAERSQHWGRMGPPLVPNQEVIDTFLELVPADKKILMLGVTPQIANAYTHVTSVDSSPDMIARVWPGNTETKQSLHSDWRTVDLQNDLFDGIIGDGSINMLGYPDDIRYVLKRVYGWLKPGGSLAMRFFTRPDEPITVERLLSEAKQPTVNFSAFRRLLPMYIAATEDNSCIRSERMLEVFDELFPDRSILPWDQEHIKSIDSYRGTTTTSWFPTRQEILEMVDPRVTNARFVDAGTYDIADTCPILTFTK
jgi:SAM-dependent methyltransferase